jgi:8-oxo-dGTP pyrophosphatase MutT (NUDIX family)
VTLSKSAIQRALYHDNFDGHAAQAKMKPVPRTETRPAHLPGQPRQGAVLLLLYKQNGQTTLVLTRRRDDLPSHPGQISLPGGRREMGERLQQTALRECYEEVGVHPSRVTILGQLTPLYVLPSDFQVTPFVGWHEERPEMVAQPTEVAEIIEAPLEQLLNQEMRDKEDWEWKNGLLEVPFFRVGEHKVWGATAMILSEFVERLALESTRC